jgi:cytidylate kinase
MSKPHSVNLESEHRTRLVTAGGWARSGKGTSMSHLKGSLESSGKSVALIDQGIKFRAMGIVAIESGEPLDSPATLESFLHTAKAQEATMDVIEEVGMMDEAARKARLYTPDISKASGKVGKVPSAHVIAVRLLRTQVAESVEAETDIVIIDGRSIEKYAKQFDDEGMAKFVIGWFFKCDPAIAARKSLGICGEVEDMGSDDRQSLLSEILNISDRNRSDTLRDVDPLQEPPRAYHLDLLTYGAEEYGTPYKRAYDILDRHGLAVVDTSYTNCIEEMTGPVTELSRYALFHRGALTHEDMRIQTIK